MYISKKRAQKLLREHGFTVAAAHSEVEKLRKKVFGKREKVKLADINALCYESSQPSPVIRTRSIRPFSKKLIAQLQKNLGV